MGHDNRLFYSDNQIFWIRKTTLQQYLSEYDVITKQIILLDSLQLNPK